jgi:hypothetical protein
MREILAKLIKELDPDIQELVAEVIRLEREHLDMIKPRGVVQDIREQIDKYAAESLRREAVDE